VWYNSGYACVNYIRCSLFELERLIRLDRDSYDQPRSFVKELLTTFFVEFTELFFPTVADYLDTGSISTLARRIPR
jgi:hypothetical protein